MKNVFLLISFTLIFKIVYAQEEVSFSDEELTRYASVMAWAEEERSRMTGIYNGWIKNDENLAATRFVKIRRAKGDSIKLRELEVTDVESTAFYEIQTKYDSMISSFTETYKGKIKEQIGNALYNSVKKNLKKSSELKTRYAGILERVKSEAKKEDESDE